MGKKLTLYLANPLGFSEFGRKNLIQMSEILEKHYIVNNPFTPTDVSKQLDDLDNILNAKTIHNSNSSTYINLKEKYTKVNFQLGKQNQEAIAVSYGVFAILNGIDVDSGVAAEIGYAFGLGKPIWGYRNDFRRTGENPGTIVNLQVEYFIRASGGTIFQNLNEVKNWVQSQQSK